MAEILIITQNLNFVDYLAKKGITGNVTERARFSDVEGKIIYTDRFLPLAMLAKAEQVYSPDFPFDFFPSQEIEAGTVEVMGYAVIPNPSNYKMGREEIERALMRA